MFQPSTGHQNEADFMERVANHEWQGDYFSPIQEMERKRLPETYLGMENGHMASHQFLIDDFCSAAFNGRQPVVNAWKAARYTVPGLIAHQSMMKGGITLEVPDFGDYV